MDVTRAYMRDAGLGVPINEHAGTYCDKHKWERRFLHEHMNYAPSPCI